MGDTACGNIGGNNNPSIQHTHNIAHAHQWGDVDDLGFGNTALYSLTSLDDSVGGFDYGDVSVISGASRATDDTGSYKVASEFLDNAKFYTSGVLSPPSGAAGSTASSGNMSANNSHENRPAFLSCFYIRKIK